MSTKHSAREQPKSARFNIGSQSDQEMDRFCCAKEAQSTPRNDDFFDFRSIRGKPIGRAFSLFRLDSNEEQWLIDQRLGLLLSLL